MKVESRYKNPDEYIRKLKTKIKLQRLWLDEDRERRNKLRGDLITGWSNKATTKLSCTTNIFGNLHAGDKIAVMGIVETVTEDTESDGSFCSSIDYKLLETRRIKE